MQTYTFWKTLRILIAAIIVVILLLGILKIYQSFTNPGNKVNLNQSSVVTEMQSLNRLETASFTIEKIIQAGTQGNAFQNILYGDKILLIAHAQVIAGFDLSKLKSEDVKVEGDTLTISLPAPEILVSKLDNEKTQIYDRQKGIFAASDKDLESEARAQAEQSIRKAACDEGILATATENAKKQIQAIFLTGGFAAVNINAETGSCE